MTVAATQPLPRTSPALPACALCLQKPRKLQVREGAAKGLLPRYFQPIKPAPLGMALSDEAITQGMRRVGT